VSVLQRTPLYILEAFGKKPVKPKKPSEQPEDEENVDEIDPDEEDDEEEVPDKEPVPDGGGTTDSGPPPAEMDGGDGGDGGDFGVTKDQAKPPAVERPPRVKAPPDKTPPMYKFPAEKLTKKQRYKSRSKSSANRHLRLKELAQELETRPSVPFRRRPKSARR